MRAAKASKVAFYWYSRQDLLFLAHLAITRQNQIGSTRQQCPGINPGRCCYSHSTYKIAATAKVLLTLILAADLDLAIGNAD